MFTQLSSVCLIVAEEREGGRRELEEGNLRRGTSSVEPILNRLVREHT